MAPYRFLCDIWLHRIRYTAVYSLRLRFPPALYAIPVKGILWLRHSPENPMERLHHPHGALSYKSPDQCHIHQRQKAIHHAYNIHSTHHRYLSLIHI